MRLARAVWLTVAVLAVVGLVIATRVPGGPQAIISALQTEVVTRHTQGKLEATASTRQTREAQRPAASPPRAFSPVLGTPAIDVTTSMDPWVLGQLSQLI
jgi:hypothetical protein